MDYGSVLKRQIAERALDKLRRQPSFQHDIAVIGMACRFPKARDLSEYWGLLSKGVDAVEEIPEERWDWREYYDDNPEAENKMYNRWGGFISDIDQFDPLFFKISPKEAELMDPQHRIFLEIAWRTLEHAGYGGSALSGTDTGVFVGCTNTHYSKRYRLEQGTDDYYLAALGNWNAALASRVSYFLDWHGPSLLVDTLCSSSLAAIHAACNSIRREECSAALVGGVNLILTPEHFIAGSKLKAHSPDGRCKTFDHRANGFTSGEGAGAVLLKPLSAALNDKDTIYGIIKGSAVNHDGHTNGIMAPNPKAQARVIRKAHKDAKIEAQSVSYIECHGTGTSLGDPIEIEGLKQAFEDSVPDGRYCSVGSVKSNIGHLEAAAGMAGLIKVLLSMKYKKIPASLHYEKANPHIDFEHSPFFVNSKLTDWRSNSERTAGISSFGLSGINAHIIVQEPPALPCTNENIQKRYLLPISARSDKALKILIDRYRLHLAENSIALDDVCYTACISGTKNKYRIAIIGASRKDIMLRLEQCANGDDALEAGMEGIYYGVVSDADFVSSRRDKAEKTGDVYEQLASAYVEGVGIDWSLIYQDANARHVPLPPYPFERIRCWPGEEKRVNEKSKEEIKALHIIRDHPLLGEPKQEIA